MTHVPGEQDLGTITLTPQAVTRLGIRTATVERKPVERKRTFGGELLVPSGGTIMVTAPLNGTLAAPIGGKVRLPGEKVAEGDEIFSWLPLLSPERSVLTPAERVQLAQARATLSTMQIEAQRQLESAKVQSDAAQLALARAEQLLKDRAGSQRAVDEAKAQVSLARETFLGAQQRHELLSKTDLEAEGGKLTAHPIKAPVSGILRRVDVSPGQTVAAGTLLFEIVKQDRLWIRVPVFVGQWREIDPKQDAIIREFGHLSPGRSHAGTPVTAPPSADPLAATVDLFYAMPNEQGEFRPGQKVAVTLPLRGQEESLVLPWSAVLYDIHGGAWVYEQTAPATYVRRRIDIRFVSEERAVLASGPPPGTTVVIEGAAELFGTEFGIGK